MKFKFKLDNKKISIEQCTCKMKIIHEYEKLKISLKSS